VKVYLLLPRHTFNISKINTRVQTPCCSALRASLKDSLTPEQLTVLLQGTAGLYQDLRAEVKNRVQVFEEYALAEILRLPPGLLADLVDSGADRHDDDQLEISEEEERKLDDTLTTLRQEIAARKRRTREINAAITALDARMKTTEARLAALRTVPSAVAGQGQGLLSDFKVIAERGAAVQVRCDALEATIPMNEGGDEQGDEPVLNDLDLMEREDDAKAFADDEDAEELQAEKEISRRYSALTGKELPSASNLRRMREALGMV
jgi:hypothetical protein